MHRYSFLYTFRRSYISFPIFMLISNINIGYNSLSHCWICHSIPYLTVVFSIMFGCAITGRERERVGAVIFSFYILPFPICVSGCWHSSSSSSIYTTLFYHAWVSKFQIQFNTSSTPLKGLIILGLNSKVRVQDVCVGCRGFRGGMSWGAPMNCRAAQLFVCKMSFIPALIHLNPVISCLFLF
ncbi:uncharacterized protein LOC126584522 [Malus sylvestris]|uniref:uncharacterized protein LOC126584522 n=1 Tax=Malus sylvestris TaxID=3752 RepID=UPI0021AC64DE|nr:uncharacterized protein LOC126584522 [Malus sylvestris]